MSANARPRGPGMYDPQMWERLGIDMKTGLPSRLADVDERLKRDIKIELRVKDEQDAINRYTWNNLPLDLSSQEVERMLYQRQNLILFYMKDLDKFYLMPYAFDSGLDFYGRPIYVHPVPYASGTANDSEERKSKLKTQEEYLRNIKLKVAYDVQIEEDFYDEEGNFDEQKAKDIVENSCVIIRDYTPQYSENGIPRVQMQDAILDVMSDCIPFSRTALLNSTGVVGLGTQDSDEDAAVYGFSNSVNNAALTGKKYLPIRKKLELQELTGGQVAKSDEFLQMMQGYNNFRLSLYGLDNNGLYDKKAYVNNMQSGVNNVGLSLQDGLTQRQHSCNIANSIWGIMIWCDISETVSGLDTDLDGKTYDDDDEQGSIKPADDNMERAVAQNV